MHGISFDRRKQTKLLVALMTLARCFFTVSLSSSMKSQRSLKEANSIRFLAASSLLVAYSKLF